MANMHSHLREGDVVESLIDLAIEGGADCLLPMPNTQAGLCTAEQVLSYMQSVRVILQSNDAHLVPTVMINEQTTIEMIDECVNSWIVDGKIYPLDRTTKSHSGVRDYSRLLPIIKHCGQRDMKVHVHPEHPWMTYGNRDAEFAFLPIVDMFLRDTKAVIIWEHGTDARCIPFWKEMAAGGRFYVTLTAHHMVADEDSTFGDVRAICKPPIKTRRDRLDLVRLVEEDHPWVMAGLDDAPHDRSTKHVSQDNCACGAYTSPFGLQLYAHALDDLLTKCSAGRGRVIFENFISRNARMLHDLPPASRQMRLVRSPFEIPASYSIGSWTVEPFWAKKVINWTLKTD